LAAIIVSPGATSCELSIPIGPPVRTSTDACGPSAHMKRMIRASSGAICSRMSSYAGWQSSSWSTSADWRSSSAPRSRSGTWPFEEALAGVAAAPGSVPEVLAAACALSSTTSRKRRSQTRRSRPLSASRSAGACPDAA
jgi:hypothetical protein